MGWEVRFEKGLFFKRLSPARGRGGERGLRTLLSPSPNLSPSGGEEYEGLT
jgi:hypothetical protein